MAAILGRLSVSRTALGRVLALLVLLGVCLVALAALLIIRAWMLAVLGLTVSLLALWWVIALLWLRGVTLLRGVVSLALLVIVTGSAAAVLILRGSTVRHVDIGGNKGRLLGKC